MAHKPMHINHWIEIDREYKWYLDEKATVIKEQGLLDILTDVAHCLTEAYLGKTVVDSLPENDEACGELLMELVDYLPKRYPTLFTREGNDAIVNLVMGERHLGLSEKKGSDALHTVSRYGATLERVYIHAF